MIDRPYLGTPHVYLERDWSTDDVSLWVYFRERGSATQTWAIDMALVQTPIETSVKNNPGIRPLITDTRVMRDDSLGLLRKIFEALWADGMRPSDFNAKDHANELTAVRYHLEDMRKLAKVKE